MDNEISTTNTSLIKALRIANDIQRAFIDRALETQISPKTTSSALLQGFLDLLSSFSVSGEDGFRITLLVAAGYFEFHNEDDMPIKVDKANRRVTIERNAMRLGYRIFDMQPRVNPFAHAHVTHPAFSNTLTIKHTQDSRLKLSRRTVAGIEITFAWCDDEYKPDCFINASSGTCRYLAALQEFERLAEKNKDTDFGDFVLVSRDPRGWTPFAMKTNLPADPAERFELAKPSSPCILNQMISPPHTGLLAADRDGFGRSILTVTDGYEYIGFVATGTDARTDNPLSHRIACSRTVYLYGVDMIYSFATTSMYTNDGGLVSYLPCLFVKVLEKVRDVSSRYLGGFKTPKIDGEDMSWTQSSTRAIGSVQDLWAVLHAIADAPLMVGVDMELRPVFTRIRNV